MHIKFCYIFLLNLFFLSLCADQQPNNQSTSDLIKSLLAAKSPESTQPKIKPVKIDPADRQKYQTLLDDRLYELYKDVLEESDGSNNKIDEFLSLSSMRTLFVSTDSDDQAVISSAISFLKSTTSTQQTTYAKDELLSRESFANLMTQYDDPKDAAVKLFKNKVQQAGQEIEFLQAIQKNFMNCVVTALGKKASNITQDSEQLEEEISNNPEAQKCIAQMSAISALHSLEARRLQKDSSRK